MTAGPGNNGGNGSHPGGDDFEPLIRDRETDFGSDWDNPRADYDPYADFAAGGARQGGGSQGYSFGGSGLGGSGLGDRGLVDAITRIIDSLATAAGDALAPDTRRQLEKLLRDLLVVLRDVIDAMIERIDNRREDDFEIEEIPID